MHRMQLLTWLLGLYLAQNSTHSLSFIIIFDKTKITAVLLLFKLTAEKNQHNRAYFYSYKTMFT